jgi:hypothetical protein
MNIGLIMFNLAIRILSSKKVRLQKSLNKARAKALLTKSKSDDYRVLVLQFMLDNVPDRK